MWRTAIFGFAGATIGNLAAMALDVNHTSGIDWIRHALQSTAAAILVGIAAPIWNKRKAVS